MTIINSIEEYLILYLPLFTGIASFVALAIKICSFVKNSTREFQERDSKRTDREDAITQLVRLNYEKDARISELLKELEVERHERAKRKNR